MAEAGFEAAPNAWIVSALWVRADTKPFGSLPIFLGTPRDHSHPTREVLLSSAFLTSHIACLYLVLFFDQLSYCVYFSLAAFSQDPPLAISSLVFVAPHSCRFLISAAAALICRVITLVQRRRVGGRFGKVKCIDIHCPRRRASTLIQHPTKVFSPKRRLNPRS